MKYVTKEQKPEETQVVSLEDDYDGIAIKVGDYYIVTLRHDGRVVRHSGVSPETGLKLDGSGSVVVEDE
jgi:hypothetical protein